MRRILVVGLAVIACSLAFGVAAKPSGKDAASVRESADKARKNVKKAKDQLAKGFAILQDARSLGDGRRIECVNGALTQMKGLMRLADNSLLELEEAEAANNATTVARSSTKVAVVTKKVGNSFRRLKSCMGNAKEGEVPGDQVPLVTVEPDPDIPNVDPTEGLKDLPPQLETPPSASPFFS